MELFGKNKEKSTSKKKEGGNLPNPGFTGGGFWGNVIATLFILFLLTGVYSFLSDRLTETEDIPLSTLAQEIRQGNVTAITVQGEDLTVTYKDSVEKTSKKEAGTALTETFANYGVTATELSHVEITVEGPSGFRYFLLTFAPFLLQILLIGFFIWFL